MDKLTLENYAKMCHEVFNISSIGLRLFNVYGPGQNPNNRYSAVIPIFLKDEKKCHSKINGGYQTRDFIFVEDVVKVMLLSMSKIHDKRKSMILNVGSGKSITINYLYKIMKKKLRSRSKFVRKKPEKFDPKKVFRKSFDKLKDIYL